MIVELGRDLRELHAFAAELESGADVAPVVVGAWSRETFLGEDPSSAYLIEATRARVRDFVRRRCRRRSWPKCSSAISVRASHRVRRAA